MHFAIPKVDICVLSENREEDIMISRFSDYLEQHANLVAPHRHSFYHLLFFTEGSGVHTIDFHHFKVIPGQIYFMIPGQVHSWSFEGRVDGYVVNFSELFFNSFLLKQDYLETFSFFRGVPQSSVIDLVDDIKEKISCLFEQLIGVDELTQNFRDDLIRVVLLQIFILIQNSTASGKDQREVMTGNVLLKNYQRLVEKNFLTLRLPGEYASLLHITPNHLNALCKEHLGVQAGQVIRDRVLLEAKRMLVNIELSVSEIAYKLNFTDNSYFSKFFKKEAGVTPEEFRKRNVRHLA